MPRETEIKIRRGLEEQWSSTNPVLDDGEIAWSTDEKKFKVGDGTNNWNNLNDIFNINDNLMYYYTTIQDQNELIYDINHDLEFVFNISIRNLDTLYYENPQIQNLENKTTRLIFSNTSNNSYRVSILGIN
jgi:hypothetical protein